jgi:sugar/nucleoside kinase (ribokinase family)
VVVGDVMLDVIVKPLAPVAPTSDTPARVRVGRGGAAANLAVSLAACGHHVVFVGACGDDAASQIFHDGLVDAGVVVRLQVTESATGVVVALVGNDAQRAMLTDRGANPLLAESFVEEALGEPFDHLHVSGYTLLDPATRGVGTTALRRAREAGRSSSVDVCSVAPLGDITPEVFLVAAREASMLFANEEEALALSSARDSREALETLSRDFGEVVITRGPLGAMASHGAARAEARSQSDEVVDTTGAGDAATGAFLGARLSGESLEGALERAMAASARVVRGLGSRA